MQGSMIEHEKSKHYRSGRGRKTGHPNNVTLFFAAGQGHRDSIGAPEKIANVAAAEGISDKMTLTVEDGSIKRMDAHIFRDAWMGLAND